MGQQASKSQPEIDAIAAACFREIDKFSLKQFISDEELIEAIGIKNPTVRRSAQFFASFPKPLEQASPISSNLLKVVAWYNQKLPAALGLNYTQFLFLSLAVQTGDVDPLKADVSKFYIGYADLLDFVAACCQVYDKQPTDEFGQLPDMAAVAQQILGPWQAPVIGYDSFLEVLDRFPHLLKSLSIIWDQVLYEKRPREVVSSPFELLSRSQDTFLKRDHLCLLYMCRGQHVLDAIKLYNARKDGFSMRSFESKVVNWKAPTFLVLKGIRKGLEWSDVPPVTDTLKRDSKRVVFCVYVDAPWKTSKKNCFAGSQTTIYQLEPTFEVFKATTSEVAYFSPDVGIGFGLLPPQSKHIIFGRNSNTALLLDRFLEHAVFRCVGSGTFAQGVAKGPYEDRFKLNAVEVWGDGNEQVLKAQKLAWAWEDAEAKKRQGVNIGEDRSILEMAGIIGQYDPDRGTN